MGPFLTVNSFRLGLYIMVPMISAGSKSGVNWMRLNFELIAFDKALMAIVLANPGKPSNKTCPFVKRPKSKRSIICS